MGKLNAWWEALKEEDEEKKEKEEEEGKDDVVSDMGRLNVNVISRWSLYEYKYPWGQLSVELYAKQRSYLYISRGEKEKLEQPYISTFILNVISVMTFEWDAI